MEQMKFSEFISSKKDNSDKAGEGYEALSELSKIVIDYAVEKYVQYRIRGVINGTHETATKLDSLK